MSAFSAKERERFLKLLTLAKESTFEGERANALAAAENMARAHGMSLMEASGMSDADEQRLNPRHTATRPEAARAHAAEEFAFGGGFRTNWGRGRASPSGKHSTDDWAATDKARYMRAMEEARRRGLDREEEERQARAERRVWRRASGGAWRSRREFVRILLKETAMSMREVAATAGVSLHEVVKERLLMRRRKV